MERTVKAAAVHAAPVFMNKVATIKKVVELIKKAKEDTIELLVFPETFVPGYPVCQPNTDTPLTKLIHRISTLSNATHRLSKSQLSKNTPSKALWSTQRTCRVFKLHVARMESRYVSECLSA